MHFNGVLESAYATRVKGLQVKGRVTLHFTQELETLKTGSLLFIRGDFAGFST